MHTGNITLAINLPREISFACSCPDWASMCKHVAAVLYGIGSRLDREPALFFELRKIDMQELITESVKEQSAKLLHKAKGKSTRILADENLAGIFGVDIELKADDVPAKKTAGRKQTSKQTTKKPAKSAKAVKEANPKDTKRAK